MRRSVRAQVTCLFACVGLVSCGGGGTSTVPTSPVRTAPDGLIVTLRDAQLRYDAEATVTTARGLLFIRSTSRAAALELAAVQDLTRTQHGISTKLVLANLAAEKKFFTKPGRSPQGCPIAPQLGAPSPLTNCSSLPPDADLFEKMQYATGPGDIIPGRAHGGRANCDNYFRVGTWWRNVNFDIITGDGDPNGSCVSFADGGGGSFGPTLGGSARDYRYDAARGVVALDMGLPGDKNSTRSYLLRYRGPSIPIDGEQGSIGTGQTSATFYYWLGWNGPSGLFSTLQIDVYQGALAPLGPYLGFGRGVNPRLASIE
jgi:hypothetical protein